MTSQTPIGTDQELKARHRAMWALGDYGAVARRVIPTLGPVLVKASGAGQGDRVLDVAAGPGNVAIAAALVGADVTALDLTPELLEVGRQDAETVGARVRWQAGDAESLPFADCTFDVVVSCVGVMFAPHHAVAAAELTRVTRPDGQIGLINWTPEGFIGQMLTVMKPYAAPPPPGAQPPLLWGTEAHLRALLDKQTTDLSLERRRVIVDAFSDGCAFRDFFKANYGPTIATYARIADDPDQVASLDQELARLGDEAIGTGTSMDWEYLLVTATRS